jgi:lipopolysaccharide export system permease protein
MVIWFSSGLSLASWLKPVMLFALPQIMLISVLSLVISPWAAQRATDYAKRLESRDDVSRVAPGVFGETGNRDRVWFVESVSGETNSVQNVFLASARGERISVSMSRSGHTELAENGDRFIVLESGRRYEGTPGEADFKVTEFGRYAARIESRESQEPSTSPKTRSTLTLINEPTNAHLGELVWRVGVPVSSLVLALLAIPMSFVNPRAGRSINLLFAVFTYIVYNNLLSVSQARVSQGRLDFPIGLLLVHIGMVLLLVFMFAQRMQIIRLRFGK